MLRTGICSKPLVSSLKGALIFGTFGLSPFGCLVAFLAFGDLARRTLSCALAFDPCGDLIVPIDRPLRVVRLRPLL